MACRFRRYLHQWFRLGVYLSVAAMAISIVVLLMNVARWFTLPPATSNLDDPEQQFDVDQEATLMLMPLIPGVTVLASQLPFLFIALLLAGLVHEAGHALAAATYADTCNCNATAMQLQSVNQSIDRVLS
jgi:S2P endopeptidase